MGFIIDEQKMVEDAVFKYENRIRSSTSRLVDTTPTFVKYYHIDINETTTDTGFADVASIIGGRSPIRFNCIKNFPIYGLDQIALQLQDEEQGLDSSYQGEATILPNTIKPVEDDMFMIPVLHYPCIFRITSIAYDTMMPDNFYKISFQLEYVDDVKVKELDMQVQDEYVCILDNIGTETSCIIESSLHNTIKKIDEMYENIVKSYKAMFYSERHNVFLGPIGFNKYVYDVYQTEFINKHGLFNSENNLITLYLTNEFEDSKRSLKYSKSIYRYIELRKPEMLSRFDYILKPGLTYHDTSFYRWHDKTVEILEIPVVKMPEKHRSVLSQEFENEIRYNGDTIHSKYAELIKRYVRGEELTVKDIDLELDEELIFLNNDIEVFFFTPIVMYIIRDIINTELAKQK